MTARVFGPRGGAVSHAAFCFVLALGMVLVATVGGLVVGVGTPEPAGADPLTECTTSTGVIVAVDFAPWGGSIQRGCDATLTTGLAALQAAGFTTAGDAHDGPEFVCRIDGFPTPAQDPCVNTPPATAYWSYWHADAGQNVWSYSELGAATYRPLPGSVDAWVFGSTAGGGTDGQPSFLPSAVRATNVATPTTTATTPTTSPIPTTAPVSSGGPPAPATRAGHRSAVGGGSVTRTGSTKGSPLPVQAASGGTAPTTAPVTTPTVSAAAATTVPSTSPKIIDVTPAVTVHPSSGSPVAVLVGGAVIVALGVAAAVITWRRRRMG